MAELLASHGTFCVYPPGTQPASLAHTCRLVPTSLYYPHRASPCCANSCSLPASILSRFFTSPPPHNLLPPVSPTHPTHPPNPPLPPPQGQPVLPNGLPWQQHLLLMIVSAKLLADAEAALSLSPHGQGGAAGSGSPANSLMRNDPAMRALMMGRSAAPPVRYLMTQLTQSSQPLTFPDHGAVMEVRRAQVRGRPWEGGVRGCWLAGPGGSCCLRRRGMETRLHMLLRSH